MRPGTPDRGTELHDGTAHSLTAIAVQATLVERTARSDPEAAAEAAGAIAATTRTALADLNTILRSLRRPDTTFDLDEYVFEALRAGASGFLVKHAEPDELLRPPR